MAEPNQLKNVVEQLMPLPEQQPTPEVFRAPERTIPGATERPVELPPQELAQPTARPAQPTAPPAIPVQKSPQLQQIEKILEEDLEDAYIRLSPKEQLKFKRTGEEAAKKIDHLLTKTKVKVRKIIGLLVAWLRLIPGVNRYFIETEAKIKADKIIKLKS